MIVLNDLKRRYLALFLCTVIFLFMLCGLGLASEGGEHGGKLLDLLYRAINFALLVIILYVVIKKTTIKEFFSNRRKEIKKMLDDLIRAKDKTESSYKELEKKLKEFEIKKAEIIEQFKAEGIAEKEKIVSDAKKRATHILGQADLTIEREVQAARDRLRQEMVDISSQKAQEIITKQIKGSDQDHLVNEFIDMVERLH
ncbi:MAG TPA: hypothetical protein DDW42_03240 [Desulfobacteraceae bacterium]|nr:hypothetical protein [Desulfobacteraceae bacterium]